MIFLSAVLALIGFISLSLAMPRHYRQVRSRFSKPREHSKNRQQLGKIQKLFFLLLGSIFLIMSSIVCQASLGFAIGLVQWVGILTFTALLTSLLLTYRPHWLVKFIPNRIWHLLIR